MNVRVKVCEPAMMHEIGSYVHMFVSFILDLLTVCLPDVTYHNLRCRILGLYIIRLFYDFSMCVDCRLEWLLCRRL